MYHTKPGGRRARQKAISNSDLLQTSLASVIGVQRILHVDRNRTADALPCGRPSTNRHGRRSNPTFHRVRVGIHRLASTQNHGDVAFPDHGFDRNRKEVFSPSPIAILKCASRIQPARSGLGFPTGPSRDVLRVRHAPMA